MKIRKWLTTLVVGVLAAGGLVTATALPASANNIDITCTTAWLEPHLALQNGDHNNNDISAGGQKFQTNAYVDRNIAGGYDTLGLRLTTPKGQIQVPLTESEVKSGRLTFNFGQYLTGKYTVEWAQFNNSYFNQDRKPNKFLDCGKEQEQPKKVVVCKYVSTPGLGERPSHLIEVSVNALKDFPGTFPWVFADAQGGSVALGYAPGDYTLADCPYEKPEKPADLTGVEKRELPPVCVEPLNGTATIALQERAWKQEHVWDDAKGWVLGEKAYTGDWTTVDTKTVDSEDCEPPTPEIPEKPEDIDPEKTSVPGEWKGGEPTCKDQEVEQTRTVEWTETTYDWIFNTEKWVWEKVAASSTWTTEEKRNSAFMSSLIFCAVACSVKKPRRKAWQGFVPSRPCTA